MLVLDSPSTVSLYWPALELALLTWPGGAIWTWRGRPALDQVVGRA